MRVKLPDWVTMVRRHSQSAAQLQSSLRAALLRVTTWFVVATRTAWRVWWRLPARIRARIYCGAMAVVSFSVLLAFTGVTRYIAVGAGLAFLLCVALPRVPGGLLELLGFRRGLVQDRSGWGWAQTICESLSVGIVGVLLCVYLVIKSGQPNSPGTGDFSVIVTAVALGALMIAVANSSTIGDTTREKALMAGQKLIVAGITLALFSVFFMVYNSVYNSLGGVDPSTLDFSLEGWKRGVSFWLTELSLVIGGILFAAGIVEVAFVLREIRVVRWRK